MPAPHCRRSSPSNNLYSHIFIDVLFVVAVSLIWFMLAYQSLLFFLGHRY
jgi:hypothetical protein